MILSMCMTASMATLPALPGMGSGRPGPANKGLVYWEGMVHTVVAEEVNQQDSVSTEEQEWTRIPDWLFWSTAHMTGSGVAGDVLVLECPADAGDNAPCTFYVTLYNCVPCSAQYNGDLPAALIAAGFTSGSCGPRYVPIIPEAPKEEYQTSIYKITVAGGAAPIQLTLNRNLLHVAVFELSIGQQCFLQGSSGCIASDTCTWVASEESCIDKPMCPPKPQGPQPFKEHHCKCLPDPTPV
eukprot:TRINITY_DN15592_c0_g1_i1.p1 TRINITY_DN15592_c0_g1~~TRINITY_DN15592_c0_g1_i1.p1  ORF type:complete len:254 (+),score=69.75 TRINITY_DN15592_c0_g1_i1:43-762(+)